MKRILFVIVVLSLLVASCGGAPPPESSVVEESVLQEALNYGTCSVVYTANSSTGDRYYKDILRCQNEDEVCWVVVNGDGVAIDCLEEREE